MAGAKLENCVALDEGGSGIPQIAYRTVAAGTCFPPQVKI